MADNGIVPFQRIKEMEYFYTSDSVKNDKVIEVVDVKDKKKFSEEVQGQWVLEQIEAVLDILRIKAFVIPKDKGGVEIPVIKSREEYMEAHLEAKHKTLLSIIDAQDAREAYIEVLRSKMEKSKTRRETVYNQVGHRRHGGNDDANEEEELQIDEAEENIEAINEEFAKAYAKWNKEQQSQNEDMLRQESIMDGCRKQSSRQHDEDSDAANRLLSSLFILKKFIQGLMKKFPFMEDIVRQKREDGIDPYDDNDMRSSYGNLLDRYRQSDEMGILTTIMSGMAEKQGSKSMSAFMLCVEDWHQTMIRLGVQTISMSDLAAIITLKGMNENNRIEFLQQENALELTLDTLENDEDTSFSDGTSVASAKKEKKSLLVRVKKFIQQDKTKKLINERLSGGSGISNSSQQQTTRKEAEDRLKEAQNVFMTTLDKNICKSFASTGKCRFGSSCRFKHEETALSKVQQGEKNQNQGQPEKSQFECYSWRDYGTCTFGDKCRFQHGKTSSTEKVDVVKASNAAPKSEGKATKIAKVTSKLFNIDDKGDSWGNEKDEKVECILADGDHFDDSETVMYVKKKQQANKLGWDTMASIHVANDMTRLRNLRPLQEKRTASGMGGTLPITHQGYNDTFGLQMHVIEGGNTPNIKSVGRSLQQDGDGTEYVAIFTANGATQVELTPRAKLQLMQIMNEAEEEERIKGTAIQRNGIYEEFFGGMEHEDASTEDNAFAVTSMYTHRVPMSSADDIIGMLASACVKEEHLIAGIRQHSIKGLPECVTEQAVKNYFQIHGKDKDVIMAEITNAPLRVPIDYEPEVFNQPGEHLQLDNVDPSFSRIKGENTPVRAIGGYRDAVVAVDNSGYSVVVGREKKKDPHLIVQRFMDQWIARWNRLRQVSADKEFVTVETVIMCKNKDIRIRQAVPADHRRGLGASEGLNRWLQDCAQVHMNRLSQYVAASYMTEMDKRSLWYHALTYANDIKLLGPSRCDPQKTQFEEGEGVKFNFSKHVVLPFGLRVVVRKKTGDQDGRGLDGIYVGFSKVVVGGILVYLFGSKRVVQKYTFVPREPMPSLTDIDIEHAVSTMYGDIHLVGDSPPDKNRMEFDKVITSEQEDQSKVGGVCVHGRQESNEKVQERLPESSDDVAVSKGEVKSNEHKHYTRSKKNIVLVVTSDKPPKPKVPTRREARKLEGWRAAFRREIEKLKEENVMVGLQKDKQGKYIRPENAVVMRLLAVLEWKWKPDPVTGIEGWLECVRIVCDGSTDKREGEISYAETPDRTLLYLMLSIEATLGIRSMVGDAIRAYLNADSLDKNLVVIADDDMTSNGSMEGLERESSLLKGLYGSTKGALSFQVWADTKLAEILYVKCDVARGVYMKTVEDDIVRLYRHSDDFKISAKQQERVEKEVDAIQTQIRTTPFSVIKDFLGVSFTRVNSETMRECADGDIFLVTMIGNINKLDDDFGYLRKQMNPTGRVRYTPLPLKPVVPDEELTSVQKELLSAGDIKTYMSLVMSMGWVIGNIRPNLKYSHHILSKRLSNPRTWDLYLAVWTMEHMILTREWPLILGGPVVDPEVHSDASFATMEERRSVVGHTLRSGPKSGVIYANIKTTKVAIKSVFEAETYAASDGQDTSIYGRQVIEELKYPSADNRNVFVDNAAAIDWMLGSLPTKRSKHMEVRLYRARHLVEEGEVVMKHVSSDQNIADLLTKSLPREQYHKLAKMMLGHELIDMSMRFWEVA